MQKRFLALVSAVLLLCLPTQLYAQSRVFAAPPNFVSTNGNLLLHFPGVFGALTSASGSTGPTWQVGQGGPLWNNNAGVFEAKDPSNTTLVVVRGAPPVGSTDFTQKAYADTHVGGSTLPTPPSSGTTVLTDTTGTLSWSATASGFTAGLDLSGTLTSQTVIGLQGRALTATAPTTGNGYYWTGTTWAPSALNLAGGTAFITGILPAASQAAQVLGGDLSGTTAAAAVTGLRGNALPAPSGTNTALTWTGSALAWSTTASGFTAATDLAGTSTSQTVVGFQGRGVTATAPAAGNAYYWGGASWAASALNLAGGAGSVSGVLPAANQAAQTLAGDVTGATTATTVGRILNQTVPALAPGYLHYNGTVFVWDTPASGGGFTAGTDLTGTSTNQTVVGFQGRSVAATAPTTGNGYYWNGSTWTPSALALNGGAAFVSGVLPAANQAAQTLAGDVGGTTAASVLATVNGNVGTFGSASTIPIVTFNAKGLATSITTATVAAALGSATGLLPLASLTPGTN